MEHHNGEARDRDILLKHEISINGDQHGEPGLSHQLQKSAIPPALPPLDDHV